MKSKMFDRKAKKSIKEKTVFYNKSKGFFKAGNKCLFLASNAEQMACSFIMFEQTFSLFFFKNIQS